MMGAYGPRRFGKPHDANLIILCSREGHTIKEIVRCRTRLVDGQMLGVSLCWQEPVSSAALALTDNLREHALLTVCCHPVVM